MHRLNRVGAQTVAAMAMCAVVALVIALAGCATVQPPHPSQGPAGAPGATYGGIG